jgi:hypothetical protein
MQYFHTKALKGQCHKIFSASINDTSGTGGKFTACVVDTGDKFATTVVFFRGLGDDD